MGLLEAAPEAVGDKVLTVVLVPMELPAAPDVPVPPMPPELPVPIPEPMPLPPTLDPPPRLPVVPMDEPVPTEEPVPIDPLLRVACAHPMPRHAKKHPTAQEVSTIRAEKRLIITLLPSQRSAHIKS